MRCVSSSVVRSTKSIEALLHVEFKCELPPPPTLARLQQNERGRETEKSFCDVFRRGSFVALDQIDSWQMPDVAPCFWNFQSGFCVFTFTVNDECQFKDENILYRFRKDDGTFPWHEDVQIFLSAQKMFNKYAVWCSFCHCYSFNQTSAEGHFLLISDSDCPAQRWWEQRKKTVSLTEMRSLQVPWSTGWSTIRKWRQEKMQRNCAGVIYKMTSFDTVNSPE